MTSALLLHSICLHTLQQQAAQSALPCQASGHEEYATTIAASTGCLPFVPCPPHPNCPPLPLPLPPYCTYPLHCAHPHTCLSTVPPTPHPPPQPPPLPLPPNYIPPCTLLIPIPHSLHQACAHQVSDRREPSTFGVGCTTRITGYETLKKPMANSMALAQTSGAAINP